MSVYANLCASFRITPESFHYLVFQRRRADVERWIEKCDRFSKEDSPLDIDVDALMEHADKVHNDNHSDGEKNS